MPRSLRTIFLLAALLAPTTTPVFTQQPTFHDALLDHLAGRWTLQGTIAGKPTVHDIDAEWVMGHQYLRFHEVSRDLDPQKHPAYEATAFIGWNSDLKQYACVWLDTYGDVAPESIANAKPSTGRIAFLFQAKDGNFHTTFIYHAAADSWEMNMENESKGVLSPFARTTLTRAH
ncbi:MAG: hypothetical protein WA802_02500 [Terracidiphilus sp.]